MFNKKGIDNTIKPNKIIWIVIPMEDWDLFKKLVTNPRKTQTFYNVADMVKAVCDIVINNLIKDFEFWMKTYLYRMIYVFNNR